MSTEEKATSRIPSSLSEWCASLPPQPPLGDRLASTSSELERIKEDLDAMLEPTDATKLKPSESADGTFRFEATKSAEAS